MIQEPNCSVRRCRHFAGVRNDGDETTERCYCTAFPQRIPDEIAYGDEQHLQPHKGDNGIQFEETEE